MAGLGTESQLFWLRSVSNITLSETSYSSTQDLLVYDHNVKGFKSIFLKPKFYPLLISSTYFLSWGNTLQFLEAYFWDDWQYKSHPERIEINFRQAGFPWIGFIHNNPLGFNPYLYRILGFISFLLAGLCIFYLMNSKSFIYFSVGLNSRLFVSVVYLILPLTLARHSLNVTLYSVSNFLFFLGWLILIRFPDGNKKQFFVCFLFLCSFNMQSLVLFFLFPVVHSIFESRFAGKSVRTYFKSNYLVVVSPFLWMLIKSVYFPSYGLYKDYNLVSLKRFLLSMFLFAVVFLTFAIWHSILKRKDKTFSANLRLIYLALFTTMFSMYPYWLIGKQFPYNEWESRYQILLPIGVALLLLSIVKFFRRLISFKMAFRFSVCLVIVIVGYTSFQNSYFVRDWEKQIILIDWMRKNLDQKTPKLILVQDDTSGLNAMSRSYRFYEWTGMIEYATQESDFLAFSNDSEVYSRIFSKEYQELLKFNSYRLPQTYSSRALLTIKYKCSPTWTIRRLASSCFVIKIADIK